MIAVVGVGNELLKDEGFGILAVRELKNTPPKGVSLIEGGTLGLSLIPLFFEYEKIIFLDIIKVDDRPGSIYVFNLNEVTLKDGIVSSFHEVGVGNIYNTAKMLGSKACVYVVGIVPYEYNEVGEVTESLKDMLPLYLEEVKRLLIKLKV
ncbi:MAG: HyaD/HybD family hydrogenase maturation endopeptidase [bacterium]